jgi:hypothetical protein
VDAGFVFEDWKQYFLLPKDVPFEAGLELGEQRAGRHRIGFIEAHELLQQIVQAIMVVAIMTGDVC